METQILFSVLAFIISFVVFVFIINAFKKKRKNSSELMDTEKEDLLDTERDQLLDTEKN